MRYDTVLETLYGKKMCACNMVPVLLLQLVHFIAAEVTFFFFGGGGVGVENKMYTCMIVVKSALLHVIQKNGSRSSTRSGIVF